MQYPYLKETDRSYWVVRRPGYSCGCPDKTCSLANAEWLRRSYNHELNWESSWDCSKRLAFESLIAKLLVEGRVVNYDRKEEEENLRASSLALPVV